MKIYPTIRGIVILGSIFASASLLKNMPDRNVDHHSSMSQDGFNAQYTEQSNATLANEYERQMVQMQDQYIDYLVQTNIRPQEIDEKAWDLFQSIKQYAVEKQDDKFPVDLRYAAARLMMAHEYYPDNSYEGFEMAVRIGGKESTFYRRLINHGGDAFGPEQFKDDTARNMMSQREEYLPNFVKTRINHMGLTIINETRGVQHHRGLSDIRIDPIASAALFFEWDQHELKTQANWAYRQYSEGARDQKQEVSSIFTENNRNTIKYQVHLMGAPKFRKYINGLIKAPDAAAAPTMYQRDKQGRDNELMRVVATNAPFFTTDSQGIYDMYKTFNAQRSRGDKPIDVRSQFKGWRSFRSIFNTIKTTSNRNMRKLTDVPTVTMTAEMAGTQQAVINAQDMHVTLMRITKTAAHYRGLAQAEPKGRSRVYVVGKSERHKDLFAAVRPESVTVSPRLKPIG